MKQRQIAGRNVGAVALGCMSFGGFYGAASIDQSLETLATAVELGVTHWDVAEVYGEGLCEEIIGRFLRETPSDITLATKAGIYQKPERHFRNDADALRASLEGSLKRLGRDRVELFYIHRREQSRPVEQVVETLVGFIEEGLIGSFGFSEVAPTTIRRAHAVHPVAAIQNEYSLWTRQPELGVIQACEELGIALVAFSPVGRGIFADRFPDPATFAPKSFRATNPRFAEPNYSANCAAVARFRDWARSKGWATATAAVAWTLDRSPNIIPIPGTRTPEHLRQLAAAAKISFTDEDRAEIDRLLPPGFAHGARYPDDIKVGVERYC